MTHGEAGLLDPPRSAAEGRDTHNCHERAPFSERDPFPCSNRLPLTCTSHGGTIWVRCNRRRCEGCAKRAQWLFAVRLRAGIENVPPGLIANFVTLTFRAEDAPGEDEPHTALRSLVQRLRYRELLGAYAWCAQSTKRGVRHYHGIFHMPWMDDDLDTWKKLIVAAGFGPQNRCEPATPGDAGYCARYIARDFAHLAQNRRVYGFSRDFPRDDYENKKAEIAEVGLDIGLRPDCEWISAYAIR